MLTEFRDSSTHYVSYYLSSFKHRFMANGLHNNHAVDHNNHEFSGSSSVALVSSNKPPTLSSELRVLRLAPWLLLLLLTCSSVAISGSLAYYFTSNSNPPLVAQQSTLQQPATQTAQQQQSAQQLAANTKHYNSIFSKPHQPPINNNKSPAQTNSNNNELQQQQSVVSGLKRPPSSSSLSQLNEDLGDSSIRTRFWTAQGPAPSGGQAPDLDDPMQLSLASASDNFEQLIERLLRPLAAPAQRPALLPLAAATSAVLGSAFQATNKLLSSATPALMAPGDANNKTTMRFFRNNKTFASIVYTNEQLEPATRTGSGAQQPQQRQPRRLINCHLVDLEKHSADVATFEQKYRIRTIDIEFREMMQLIDACTNIARFKPPAISSLSKPPAATLSLQVGNKYQLAIRVGDNLSGSGAQPPARAATTTTKQQQPQQSPAQVANFNQLMSEIQRQQTSPVQPPGAMANSPASAASGLVVGAPKAGGYQKRSYRPAGAVASASTSGGPSRVVVAAASGGSGGLVAQALSKVSGAAGGKRLVLGEVTPPPNLVEQRGGSIREALQEITQYDTTDLLAIWRGILPGTNWCGMGDRATSYNDLGFESDIDICCRAHDFCPIRLSAFSAGYGLFNWSFYTRSHCLCDQNFLDCLQMAQSPLSSVVMRFYFTIMKTTCLHDNETLGAAGSGGQPTAGAKPAAAQQAALQSSSNKQPANSQSNQLQSSAQSQSQNLNLNLNSQNNNKLTDREREQRKLLLDQIRASLPIPALKQSLALYAKLDRKPQENAQATKRLQAGYK